MTLTLRLFAVGHGDSILLEHDEDGRNSFVLIDCNSKVVNGGLRNPALEYLKARGATELAALVITHLHLDHYFGVESILDQVAIKRLVVPPFISSKDRIFRQVIEKYREKILAVVGRTSDRTIGLRARSLARLLEFIWNHPDIVSEATGPESRLRLPEAPGMTANVLLPLKRIRGILNQHLATGDFELDLFPAWNDASIAILVTYGGHRILLTGDSTLPQWNEHSRQMRRDGVEGWDVAVVKAPHHGSKHNNNRRLFEYLYGTDLREKIVLVSADGLTHPDNEFFDLVNEGELKPYCTALSQQCSNIISLDSVMRVPAEARPFVVHYPRSAEPIPCQGDIVVVVDEGELSVFNTTGTRCVYDEAPREVFPAG